MFDHTLTTDSLPPPSDQISMVSGSVTLCVPLKPREPKLKFCDSFSQFEANIQTAAC